MTIKNNFSNKSLVPSEDLMDKQYIGHTKKDLFIQKGNELFNLLIDYGKIKPDFKILDIGCGLGRIAKPLTNFLSSEGEYWGTDIAKDSIEWCNKEYSNNFPNFNFVWQDIYNKSYNPNGNRKNPNLTFNFENSSMDCIILFSVFTHMFINDVEKYMMEIGRILKPGKKCIISWYLLNEYSIKNIKAGQCRNDIIEEFKYEIPEGLTTRKDEPEYCMSYNEDFVKSLYSKSGLIIEDPIKYGAWSGRSDGYRFQDFLFATKK